MKPLQRESIKHAITENFKSYSEDYPLQNDQPTDESVQTLVSWVEHSYEADESEEKKGTIDEWFEAAKEAFIEYFGWDLGIDYDKEEREQIESYINEQVEHVRTK